MLKLAPGADHEVVEIVVIRNLVLLQNSLHNKLCCCSFIDFHIHTFQFSCSTNRKREKKVLFWAIKINWNRSEKKTQSHNTDTSHYGVRLRVDNTSCEYSIPFAFSFDSLLWFCDRTKLLLCTLKTKRFKQPICCSYPFKTKWFKQPFCCSYTIVTKWFKQPICCSLYWLNHFL